MLTSFIGLVAKIMISLLATVAAILLLGFAYSNVGKFPESSKYFASMGLSTGNSAFDDYRRSELARLEARRIKIQEEGSEFTEFLEELKRVKDREQFDTYIAKRNSDTSGRSPHQKNSSFTRKTRDCGKANDLSEPETINVDEMSFDWNGYTAGTKPKDLLSGIENLDDCSIYITHEAQDIVILNKDGSAVRTIKGKDANKQMALSRVIRDEIKGAQWPWQRP